MATSGFFDDVVMISSPPSDAKPDDESIALVEKAGVRLVHTTIDAGYGVVRTRCIRESQAEWVMILDCDERLALSTDLLGCDGTEGYPQIKEPKLKVRVLQKDFDQGKLLKDHLANTSKENMAFRFSRRHWFGAPGDLTKPCQNWELIPDWQLRIIRNSPFVFYSPERKMHEHLKDSRTFAEPAWGTGEGPTIPYVDHHHFWAKNLDPEGRKLAVETYNKLDKAGTENMWSNTGFNDTP